MFPKPFLDPIEARFDWNKTRQWLPLYSRFSIYMSAVYLVLVFIGKRWMRDKPAFSLRRPLTMWNAGLAVFSIVGSLTMLPCLAENLIKKGFRESVCRDWVHDRPDAAHFELWSLLFVLSKTVELGDTLFVVLRKTPLNFLHWYHHVTVYIYCTWFAASVAVESGLGPWFGITNYCVHSIMYSYYTLKAAGFKIPRAVAQAITLMQLAQFVLGLATICTTYALKVAGEDCDSPFVFLNAGLAIYVSYFILFLNFFCKRYLKYSVCKKTE